MAKFKDLFAEFVSGTPIKRRVWRGYWVYENGEVKMYCKDGKIINFLESGDVLFTISGILAEDWEIATKENCELIRNPNKI